MNGKGKNNKQKQTRYSFYFWCLHFFSSYITVTLERRKQGLIMNEKNKYCPHIEKREGGNQKCELAIPWTSVIPLIFMLDNCTEIHRKEANWLGECLFLHKQRSTPVIWSRLCVTHISSHVQAGSCRREEDSYFPLLVTLTTWSQLFLSPRTVS